MTHVVKRHGQTEDYDPRKVYASVYFACRNAHLSEIQSEKIAEATGLRIDKWIQKKSQIDSSEIFGEITKVLRELHPDAALLYETHRDIS